MRISGLNWVVGRNNKQGDIQDVRITRTPEGLNRIEIARDARNTDNRRYVVDRRVLPDGAWRRLLEVDAFSSDALPDSLAEVRAIVEFETIPNSWGLTTEKTWGLPAGMESPWKEPVEMVGNELLLPVDAQWVSGDTPINININNTYKNGKYVTHIENNRIFIEDQTGDIIGTFTTDTRLLRWTEGISGAASFMGGSIFVEPAKPPLFMGTFILENTPIPLQPGLYEYGNHYLVSNVPIVGRTGVGAIAFIKDPYPKRWIKRMFGRAYVQLVSPANVPPLIEDEPSRISVEAYPIATDFSDIRPEIVTPYANKTGVFNVWDVNIPPVIYNPRERPYDLFVPFDRRAEDWAGHAMWEPGTFFPSNDWRGEPDAAFPAPAPHELPDIPEMAEGIAFFRWRDSASFGVIKTDWMRIFYKEGYIYFDNKIVPDANGIQKIIVSSGWNMTKVEWNSYSLWINDVPALIEEETWGEVLGEGSPGGKNKLGEIANIPTSQWTRNGDLPMDIEQYEEIPPTWMTGESEGEVPTPDLDYTDRPRTWGRVLFEDFEEDVA